MSEIVKKLNELSRPFFENIEKDLNKWSFGTPKPALSPGNIIYMPFLDHLGNATTVDQTVDAFALEPPFAGMIKNRQLTSYNELGQTIVINRLIGYAHGARINDGDLTIDHIKPWIKEMINKLIEIRGFTPDKLNMGIYGTFKRPGTIDEYFRECENYAGYELRLFSATTLAEKT